MFNSTDSTSGIVAIRVSFWQAVKVGIGFSLGAFLLPLILLVLQTFTKIPAATAWGLYRMVH